MQTTRNSVLPELSYKQIRKLKKDPEQTAEAAGLNYIRSDKAPGWHRKKTGRGFYYADAKGKRCTHRDTLQRIKSLALPPAWQAVWISKDPHSHLQATGIDEAGRKQYRYHPHWNQIRNHTKYFRLLQFSDVLPTLRDQLEHDLRQRTPTLEKITALVIRLMEKTSIRIGNQCYKIKNGSSGMTTMDARQTTVKGSTIRFCFTGKKGIPHTITLRDKRLASLVQTCKEMPGRRLFQYLNAEGKKSTLSARHVNEYIQKHTGGGFSAKDFRTWMGTLTAFEFLSTQPACESDRMFRQKANACLDAVAAQLGNTRTVCRKYYVHPAVLHAYETHRLGKYLTKPVEETSGLTATEQRVKILLEGFKM